MNSTIAEIVLRRVVLAAVDVLTFERDDVHFMARSGATTTALTCPAWTALPVGLRFTLDNSNGSGDMTLTPVTGTAIVVNAGEIWQCLVAANGAIFAGELSAAPTS